MISSGFFLQTCETEGAGGGRKRKITSLQLAGVGLVFLHDLPDLVSLQWRVEHLVQPRVSLPPVDELHELVQGDEELPLGAAAEEQRGGTAFRPPEDTRNERKRENANLSSKMLWISGRRQRLSRNFWKASQVKSSGLSPSDCRRIVSQEREKEKEAKRSKIERLCVDR